MKQEFQMNHFYKILLFFSIILLNSCKPNYLTFNNYQEKEIYFNDFIYKKNNIVKKKNELRFINDVLHYNLKDSISKYDTLYLYTKRIFYTGRIEFCVFKNIDGIKYYFQSIKKNKSRFSMCDKIDDCELKFLKIKLSNPAPIGQIYYDFIEAGYILFTTFST